MSCRGGSTQRLMLERCERGGRQKEVRRGQSRGAWRDCRAVERRVEVLPARLPLSALKTSLGARPGWHGHPGRPEDVRIHSWLPTSEPQRPFAWARPRQESSWGRAGEGEGTPTWRPERRGKRHFGVKGHLVIIDIRRARVYLSPLVFDKVSAIYAVVYPCSWLRTYNVCPSHVYMNPSLADRASSLAFGSAPFYA